MKEDKAIMIFDMPDTCIECPFHFKGEMLHAGKYTYEQLYRCMFCPEDVEDIYLPDLINTKPEWCPLKPAKKIVEQLEIASYQTQQTFDEDGFGNDDSEEVVDLYTAIEIVKEGLS